jgi:uncharacterized protein (DUF2237 family)
MSAWGGRWGLDFVARSMIESVSTPWRTFRHNVRMNRQVDTNVVGGSLLPCSTDPLTGFYRDGCCATGPEDFGSHTVCAVMTAEFLEFSATAGNDLSTPHPEWGFPGLSPGDRWCVCAARWLEAYHAGSAPKVVLGSTHARALEVIPIQALTAYAEHADVAE